MKTKRNTGPTISRGTSRQDWETPTELIEAVEARFGRITFDLAAEGDNAKHASHFKPADNALVQPWPRSGLCWLNPPFANIGPWASKCREEAAKGSRIAFLTPAAVGSNWFRDHVFGRALVVFLNGRITFVGAEQGYPKDCMISIFDARLPPAFDTWAWRDSLTAHAWRPAAT